jgi:sugar phosphate isomerase/epimerase
MGLYGITTESVGALDTIEKLVKEYDIKVGFHDHPKQGNNPDYRMWDPNYVVSVVKDRDARIGSCADTGHWVRSGLNPVDCLRILKGRIISSHLKDLNEMGPGAHDVPYGAGVSDVPALLAELKAQGFAGNISIEYEYHWENSTPEVGQCIGFVRGYGMAKNW